MNTEKIPTEEFTFIIPHKSEEITENEVREKTDPLYGLSFIHTRNEIVTSELMASRIKEFLEYNTGRCYSVLEIFAKVCKRNHSSSFKPFKDIISRLDANGIIVKEEGEYCSKYRIALIHNSAIEEINQREEVTTHNVNWLPKRWR